MDDEREARRVFIETLTEGLVELHAVIMADGLAFIRWLQRRVWIMRGFAFMNVAIATYNAATFNGQLWWLYVAGFGINALGAWKALRSEADFQADIKRVRRQLRDLTEKTRSIERDRNES